MEQNVVLYQDLQDIEQNDLPWEKLRGKRILCTGATGFIGRYLVWMLWELGARKNLGLEFWLFRRPNAQEWLHSPNVHWIEGEIDQEFLPDAVSPHIIIHMASPARLRTFQENPVELAKTNVLATRYLLERAKQCSAAFIFFSSAAVYGSQGSRPTEIGPLALAAAGKTFSLYGASKLAGELLCEEFRQKYQVDCRVVRPFNIHGPGDSLQSGRSFPDFLRQARQEGEIVVTGTGEPVRDSCYLSDFTAGILYILLKGEDTTYNVGNEDNACTILEMAQVAAELCDHKKVVGPLNLTSHGFGDVLVSNTSKLRRLGWRPQVDLRTCMKRCLDSY